MATLGQTTPLANSSPNTNDRLWAMKVTMPAGGGIVTGATAFFDYDTGNTSSAGDNAKFVIYADAAGSPGALVAVSSAAAVPAGDQTINFTIAASLPAGDYWIGVVSDAFNSRLNSGPGGSAGSLRKEALTYASPADPMGSPDATASDTYGVYITYTPQSGGDRYSRRAVITRSRPG